MDEQLENYLCEVAASLPLAVIDHHRGKLREVITDYYNNGKSESEAIFLIRQDFVDYLNERN